MEVVMKQIYHRFLWILALCYWLHYALVNGQSNGDLRLSLGHEGILEIYYEETWGYVCDNGWDDKDSTVACRSLRLGNVMAYQTGYNHPNQTDEFKIKDVNCTGNENNLLNCDYSNITTYCDRNKLIYLDCRLDHCQSYLHNAENPAQVVQYFNGLNWFYICKDNFSKKNSDVICYENYGTKALNYTYTQSSSLIFGYSFYPYQFKCTGDESSLCNCPIVNQTCETIEAVQVFCEEQGYGMIRLTRDADEFLQVYIDSTWMYVCLNIYTNEYNYEKEYRDYFHSVFSATMNIACRELGYSKANSFELNFNSTSSEFESRLLSGECSRYDTRIFNCIDTQYESYCPSRISLRCETESCNPFLPFKMTANSYELAQIYTDKSWFYICFDGFSIYDADVICKETAVANAISFEAVSHNSLPQLRSISPYNYSCTGNERSVCSCLPHISGCISNTVVNLMCAIPKLGSIRLSDDHYGYIEVYNGEWRRLCDSTFYSLKANIVCRSAGFRKAESYHRRYFYRSRYYYYQFYYFRHYNIESIVNIHCSGNETNLLDCSYTNDTNCYNINFVTCEKDGCETSLRDYNSLGVVQIYLKQWFSLCENRFTQQTADIICRENYKSNASGYTFRPIQLSNYPIYPFYFKCEGNENSVCACDMIPQICSSNRIVHVECNPPGNGHLRLSNGTSGTFQVYLDGGWRKVCGNNYYTRISQAVANVACRYLGYRDAVSFNYINANEDFGIKKWINISCLGNETNILECFYNFTSCYYDTYLSCSTGGCQSYISEDNLNSQPVRMYKSEIWYYICFSSFSITEGNIICRENGFLNGVESISFTSKSHMKLSYEIYPYNINCQGNESSLCDCSMMQCQCIEDKIATIKCIQPDQGTLRYSNQYLNMLEIYYNGGWSHICPNHWDRKISIVACRQLGYTRYLQHSSTKIATSFPNNFGDITCFGNESSLIDCSYNISSCGSYSSNSKVLLPCTSGDCEVSVQYKTQSFQIVEYFVDGQRYYLCADRFTAENADVVCRESVNILSISYSGVSELTLPPNTQIYGLQHSCFGNESSLCNCSTFQQLCITGLVVAVQCDTPASGSIRSTTIGKYLEVYSDGWKYVCGRYFDTEDANVACRQQGFRTHRSWTYYQYNDENVEKYWKRRLNCIGNETKLIDCLFTAINCSSRLILDCESGGCESILINGDQNQSPVRYYNGHSNYYLCKQGFTMETASVVCREGRYGSVLSIGETQLNNIESHYSIINRVYTCRGNEYSLCNCPYTIQTCLSDTVAEIQCTSTEQGQIRLTSQNDLLFYYKEWNYICSQRWDAADSDVACRQLGYRYAISSTIKYLHNYYYYYYDYHYRSIHGIVSDVACFGNESNLLECRYHLSIDCNFPTIMLECNSGGCQSYVPNALSYPQIIRYYNNGWYYLCGDGFTRENADVVCRENEGTTALTYSNVPNSDIPTYLQILGKRFVCTGNEGTLCDCHSLFEPCISYSSVKLQCNIPAYGHVRLSNRDTGVLEIYLNQWGYVCDDGWNRVAGEVVCKQLGLGSLLSFKTGVKVEKLLHPFLLDDVDCTGNESTIYECRHTLRHDCKSGEHVSVACSSNETITTTTATYTSPIITTDTTFSLTVFPTNVSQGIQPIIISPERNIQLTIIDLTMLANFHLYQVCTAQGFPQPTVTWTGDSRFITGNVLIIEPGDLEKIYEIDPPVFTCTAKNSEGADTKIVKITIDLTKIIDELENVTDEQATNITKFITTLTNCTNISAGNITEMKNRLEENANNFEILIQKYILNPVSRNSSDVVMKLLNTAQAIICKGSQVEDHMMDEVRGQNRVASASPALRTVLKAIEKLVSKITLDLENDSSFILRAGTITVFAQNINLFKIDPNILNLMFPEEEKGMEDTIKERIQIPHENFEILSSNGSNLRIATIIVDTMEMRGKNTSVKLFSNIISVVVPSQVKTYQKIKLAQPIRLIFPISGGDPNDLNQICSFLDDTYWSDDGLRTDEMNAATDCYSNHLTSFAVFVTPRDLGSNNRVASIVSYAVVSISFISLIVSLVLFILSGKRFFKVEANIVYFNYCLSLTLAFGLFLFGIETGTFNDILCKIIAFLLHYLWLSVFVWTLCNGILIIYKLTLGILRQNKIYPYLIVLGWTFPLIIPIITVAIQHDNYVKTDQHCFLTYEDGVIWAFIAPIIAIILVNMVILIISVIRISTTKFGSEKLKEKQMIKSALVSTLILTPLLGIPWIILLLNIFIADPIVQWSFIFINGLMGFFFFFAITMRNPEVRKLVKMKKGGYFQVSTTTENKSSGMLSKKFKRSTSQNTEVLSPTNTEASKKGDYFSLEQMGGLEDQNNDEQIKSPTESISSRYNSPPKPKNFPKPKSMCSKDESEREACYDTPLTVKVDQANNHDMMTSEDLDDGKVSPIYQEIPESSSSGCDSPRDVTNKH